MAGDKRYSGSFADVLRLLADHLSVKVMGALGDGPLRIADLATTGVDEATLTTTLRELDADGIVTRRVDPGPPLRVLYELTERGTELTPALDKLVAWIRERS